MLALLLTTVLAAPGDAGVPVALVAGGGEKATLERGKKKSAPEEGNLLLPGDRLTAGPGGGPTLVLLADGRRMRLKPGKAAAVGPGGLEPADAAEEVEGPSADPEVLKSLRDAYRFRPAGGAAAAVLRGGAPTGEATAVPRGTAPLYGARVLTDHPTLAWPAAAGAAGYRVQLLDGAEGPEKVLWSAETRDTRLPYPEDEAALPLGRRYRWRVTALLPGGKEAEAPAAEGKFFTASAREVARLAKVRRLAEGDDPAGWLLAADAYDAAGVYGKALPLYERLAARSPNAVSYQLALASYYARAGREADAKKARERVKELGAKAGSE
jgi:hypothetical protein